MRSPLTPIIAALLVFSGAAEAAGRQRPASPTGDSARPYQEPLFCLYAPPSSHVRLRAGWSRNPLLDSVAFQLEGALAIGPVGLHLRLPAGVILPQHGDGAFTWGDVELGVRWLIHRDAAEQRHLAVGLELIGPSSRIGEKPDVAAVQAGAVRDDSNFGKRYLLAQAPLLDMGLVPRLNFGLSPWVAFGQNLGRVSLQADFGLLVLVMDNIDPGVYGTDRRLGWLMFFDLAAPVAIYEGLSLVAEFNALVALDDLQGTGFALTIGPRYTAGGLTAGLGVQLPLGVDNDPPDDDKMLGRYDQALVASHHFGLLLDLAYRF
jgi:hypothetical protein